MDSQTRVSLKLSAGICSQPTTLTVRGRCSGWQPTIEMLICIVRGSQALLSISGSRNFQCIERGCRAGFISRDELRNHVSSVHFPPRRPPSRPTSSHLTPLQPSSDPPRSKLRSHTPAPSAAVSPSAYLISRSITPAPSSHAPPTSHFGSLVTLSMSSQDSLTGPGTKIPPSLVGYKIGTNAMTPMPLPPTTTHQNPHPQPYSVDGWDGRFPGPAAPRT